MDLPGYCFLDLGPLGHGDLAQKSVVLGLDPTLILIIVGVGNI